MGATFRFKNEAEAQRYLGDKYVPPPGIRKKYVTTPDPPRPKGDMSWYPKKMKEIELNLRRKEERESRIRVGLLLMEIEARKQQRWTLRKMFSRVKSGVQQFLGVI